MRGAIFLFTILLFACTSEDFTETGPQFIEEEMENEIPEEEDCPVEHEKSETPEPLQRRWKLVGILEDGDDQLSYPPCVGYRIYQPGFHYPYMIHLELMDIPYQNEDRPCPDCLGFSGFAGVNRIFGYYQFDEKEGSFSLGVGQTLAGGDVEMLKFEERYIKNLMATASYSLDGNELHLYYEGGKMLYTPTDEVPTGVE